MKEKKTVRQKKALISLYTWETIVRGRYREIDTHVFVWYELEHPLEGVSRAQAEVPHSRGLKNNYIFYLNVRK